jgi:hypothetical protein
VDERDPQTPTDEQSDVEGHRHKQDRTEPAASDEAGDEEGADVEAHRHKQDRYKQD